MDHHHPPVYWVNLPVNTARRAYMEAQLAAFGFRQQRRVVAIAPNTTAFKLLKLQKPCKRNTDKDLAVIMSHLKAIYAAVHDPTPAAVASPYALVLEDDVKFLFHVNYTRLVETAPKDFGILQLVSSNEEAIQGLWAAYKTHNGIPAAAAAPPGAAAAAAAAPSAAAGAAVDWPKRLWTRNLWTALTKNKRYPLYWSAQAYIVNKQAVKVRVHWPRGSGGIRFALLITFCVMLCVGFEPHTPHRPS
jgi:GR25 family glycosyltransferase involved in LPS biosynthesis